MVGLLIGLGDGTFLEEQQVLAGLQPRQVAAADLDGDGKTDIVAADGGSPGVSVLINITDFAPVGSFSSPSDATTGRQPVAAVTGDFNRDGVLDLAVANAQDGNVGVSIGRGDGSFREPAYIGVGGTPAALAAADLDRDGKLDLAVAVGGSNSVVILRGQGDGTFQAGATLSPGNGPTAVASADFDGDAIPDLAVANGQDGTVGHPDRQGGRDVRRGRRVRRGERPVRAGRR